mgnify:CR=1 FL=1
MGKQLNNWTICIVDVWKANKLQALCVLGYLIEISATINCAESADFLQKCPGQLRSTAMKGEKS